MELTYEQKGIPIAKIKRFDNAKSKIVYLNDNSEPNKKCCKKCKGIKCGGNCCDDCCCGEYEPTDEDLLYLNSRYGNRRYLCLGKKDYMNLSAGNINKLSKKVGYEARKILNKSKGKEIMISDGEVQILPNIKTRDCLYVAGPSGSGKSTYISEYSKEYKKIFPNNDVIVFSRVFDDECIDDLEPIRIKIDKELVDNPIDPQELKDALVIFDDTDTIPDKKMRDAIINLKNDLLETGRHEDIYVAITSHLMTNYKESRTILNECHTITFFPQAGSAHSIKYCLKNYCGLDKQQIQKIFSLPSRWVTVKRTYPQMVFYSKGLYFLNKD